MLLSVRTQHGDFQLVVDKADSIWHIKIQLQARTGIPTDKQQLKVIESGKYLGNQRTLEFYGITTNHYSQPYLQLDRVPDEILPGEPIYSSVFVEAEPVGVSNSETSGVKVVEITNYRDRQQQQQQLVERSATEFLTVPSNNLFEVEDVLAIILAYVDRDTKLHGCRFVNHRFKSLLSGPAPFNSQIPDIGKSNGQGCCGCFEPKELPCSGGKAHVVMAGPSGYGPLVFWLLSYFFLVSSIAAAIILPAVTGASVWWSFLVGVIIFGTLLWVLGHSWRRFVVDYRTRRVTMSYPLLMLLGGIGFCCCRPEHPLANFKGFTLSSNQYWRTRTIRDENGTHMESYQVTEWFSHGGGWTWGGKSNMAGCSDLSGKLFDPQNGFYPPTNPVWNMI